MFPACFALAAAILAALQTAPAPKAQPDRVADRARMVEVIKSYDHAPVTDARVLKAMSDVPRHLFVPADTRAEAYDDRPLPIGHGQTISQPYIVALMTQLADVRPDSKVLEVGTGSGYQAAVLAELTDSVYTVEIVPQLAASAAASLARAGIEDVRAKAADGYHGWSEHAPFDRIVVTAAAEHVPPPLIRQLVPGGRMVIPVGSHWQTQQLLLVTKDAEGRVTTRSVLPVRFVPLTGKR